MGELYIYEFIFQFKTKERKKARREEYSVHSAMALKIEPWESDLEKLFSSSFYTNWRVLNNMEWLLEQVRHSFE